MRSLASMTKKPANPAGSSALPTILSVCLVLTLFAAPGLALAGDSQINNRTANHRLIDQQRIQNLRERIVDLKDRLKEHKQQHNNGTGNSTASVETLQAKVSALESSVNTLLGADTTMLTTLQTAQSQIAALQAKVALLESRPAGGGSGPDLSQYVTIDPNPINGVNGPHLLITGVNVHIRSGSQATDDGGTPRGLGNLIIGYNEVNPSVGLPRNGSHNLVMGKMNGFSSIGGAVLGQQNRITGQYATVLGGEMNMASGLSASVLGGTQVNATGHTATVYGGFRNVASGQFSLAPELLPGGGN